MLQLPGTMVRLVLIAGVSSVAGCGTSGVRSLTPQPTRDSAAYVVRLGRDTSYIQWLVRDGDNVRMQVVERIPRVRLLRTTLTQNPDGSIAALERLVYLPAPADTAPVEHAVVRVVGDSTILEITTPSTKARYASLGRGHIIAPPFLAVSYPVLAPYAPKRAGDSVVVRLLGADFGDRALTIKRVAADTVTVYSNLTGTIRVRVDPQGRARDFNGLGSSINTEGTRVAWLPVDSVMRAFVAKERGGGPMGIASPRDTARGNIAGASLTVDYGRPSRRGRQIFGSVVPWNRVWRTGANLATHFTTDRTLKFGSAELPAGRYTLWTLPTPSGWTFIVNGQTDQWGTEYDAKFDRFRVPMQVTTLTAPVEKFTILVEPEGGGAEGVMRLRWDTVEGRVAFTVVR